MPQKSPFLLFQKNLRKQTGYATARSIATIIAFLNGLSLVLLGITLITRGSLATGLCIALGAAVWALIHSLAQAFLDIADSHLHRIHQEQLEASRTRAAQQNLDSD